MPGSRAPRAVVAALQSAVADAVRRLEGIANSPRESDLKHALRETLEEHLRGPRLTERERRPSLDGWPSVGGFDLTVEIPTELPVAIELKWGTGTLYNCAWDAVKLALALDEGAVGAAFMVAGAPAAEWSIMAGGAEFFANAEWATTSVLETHASGFAKWRREVDTRPRRLPDRFSSSLHATFPLNIEQQAWELRSVEIEVAPNSAVVHLDENGVVHPE